MALVVWLWVVGGVPAVILGEVVRAENQRIARAGRIAFALLLALDLLAARMLSVGNAALTIHASRGFWWFTVIAAGIPLSLVSGLAVSRGYTGHRVVLAVATLTTAALYVVLPLAFIPSTQPRLTGLGRFAHAHHTLDILILLVPTLILLANELRWKGEVAPDPDRDDPSSSLFAVVPRSDLIAGALLLLVVVWLAGANLRGQLLALGLVLAAVALFLWRRHRRILRGVIRDLGPPEKS